MKMPIFKKLAILTTFVLSASVAECQEVQPKNKKGLKDSRLAFVAKEVNSTLRERDCAIEIFDFKTKQTSRLPQRACIFTIHDVSPNRQRLLVECNNFEERGTSIQTIDVVSQKTIHSFTSKRVEYAKFVDDDHILKIETSKHAGRSHHRIVRCQLDGKNGQTLRDSPGMACGSLEPILTEDKSQLFYYSENHRTVILLNLKTKTVTKPFREGDVPTLIARHSSVKKCAVSFRKFRDNDLVDSIGQIGKFQDGKFVELQPLKENEFILMILDSKHRIRARVDKYGTAHGYLETLEGKQAQKFSSNLYLRYLREYDLTYNPESKRICWRESDKMTNESSIFTATIRAGKISPETKIVSRKELSFENLVNVK